MMRRTGESRRRRCALLVAGALLLTPIYSDAEEVWGNAISHETLREEETEA